MPTPVNNVEELATREYKYGFVTEVEADTVPPGLNEDIIRHISTKKNEPDWLLEWRLKAYRHWLTMKEPTWANIHYPPIDYHAITYYSAPKSKKATIESLEDIDPEVLKTYEKLGIPLREREMLAGVAVDAVFDSVSVGTTFKGKLAELGIIFCSFSEAVREHPELVKKYLGSVVPYTDNFFATLNSAVFSDGSFCYVPKGVRCPMELSTYFRINAKDTGQFERTLIIADEGAFVSYLEGCTAPMRDTNQLHAAVVELVALDNAQIKYSTVQNWYPGDKEGKGGIYNFVTKRGGVKILKSAAGARNYSQCDSLLLGDQCGAHTFPYLEVRNTSAQIEHEASTSKIGEDQIFYCRQRGISSEDAVSMIVHGFCKEVFRELPMEFAVEAQKLLGVSLEGSVG